MEILIIEPYYTGSHAAWADGIVKHSRHEVRLLTLPGRYWKWRMHGGSVTLAKKFLEIDISPDLILATDMLDLANFLALTRKKTAQVPVCVYFHENQINYPWSPEDRDVVNNRDRHYGFINYVSALSADRIFFNSHFHMSGFINALPNFLKRFPDYNELETIKSIKSGSSVLPLGIDLSRFEKYKPKEEINYTSDHTPTLLWNHRWEYDKNPEDFFNALYELDNMGYDFQLAILGEQYGKIPPEFDRAKQKLGKKIIKFGYAETFEEYAAWLWRSDILPITSKQDFFGISIIEALYCGCIPVVPKRLTYPELLPIEQFGDYFYDDNCGLTEKLKNILDNIDRIVTEPLINISSKYDWKQMIGKYDNEFETTVNLSSIN